MPGVRPVARRTALSLVLLGLLAGPVVGPVESRAASRASAKATNPSRPPARTSPSKPALTGTPSQPANPTPAVKAPRAAGSLPTGAVSPAQTTSSKGTASPSSRPVRGRPRSGRERAPRGEPSPQGQSATRNAARGRLGPAHGTRARHAGPSASATATGAVSQTGEPSHERLAAAQRTRRHHERPGGGHGGRHREPAPPPSHGKEGSGGKQASSNVSPVTIGSVTATVAPALVASAPTASPAVAPQIAGSSGQPTTQLRVPTARRSSHARQAKRASGPLAAGLPTGGTALAPSAQSTPRVVRTVASRAHVPAHATSNPLEAIGRNIPLPIPVPDWSKPIIIALLLLATWFGVRSRFAAMRARRLERQRVTLIRDLGAMQAALVPKVPPQLGGLAVSVAYRPAEGPAAGGDFYDLFTTESGHVAIMLGDVAGHGHEAVTHAALTRYTLRAYLQAGLDPRAALALAGQVLVDPTRERYATVAAALFDPQTSELTYALAGHPAPILLGFPTREPLTICSSPPIGWGLPTGRRQSTVTLPAGAEACFFSDGLIEARSHGQLLGRDRLSEILAGLGSGAAASELLQQVRAAAQGAPDDMVACVIAPQSSVASGRIQVEELEADASMLGRAAVRRFLEQCQLPTEEVTRTIELARAIAAASGTALLRVELQPTGATATVAAPSPGGSGRRSARRGSAVGQPLLEALIVR
jgi:Stage II sporulation protein E (SpoIIE)